MIQHLNSKTLLRTIQLHHFPKIFLYSFVCDVRDLTIKIPISRKSSQINA
jgi:hypothetical protein